MSPACLFFLLLGMLSVSTPATGSFAVPEAAQRRLSRVLRVVPEPRRLPELERLAQEFSTTAIVDFVHGYRSLKTGRVEEVESAFRAALAKDPQFGEAHRQLGLIFFARRDFQSAREEFDRATQTRPVEAAYWKELGRALRRLREPGRAAEAFRQASALDPSDTDTEKFLALALDEAGTSGEALAQYERAIRRAPRDARLRASRALLLERLGRIEEARKAYESALAINPREQMALTGLALLLAEQGQLEKAFTIVHRAIQYEPSNAQNCFLLAQLCQRKGSSTCAEENFRRARDLEPANALYRWQYARFLESAARSEEALSEYQSGILSHPHEPMFYSSLVQLALRQRRTPQVVGWFREVMARNPTVAELHAWTGYLYWEIAQLGEAEDEYARAVELNPLNREYAQMLRQIRERRREEWRWYAPVVAVVLALGIYVLVRLRTQS